MKFTVYTSNGGHVDYSGDDVGYSIQESSGVLLAWNAERKWSFSPAGWTHLEEPRERDYNVLDSVH